MKKYIDYISYLFRHKWYVFIECCRLGIPLRGIVHDLTKFLPDEWFPYMEFFHGANAMSKKEKQGYIKPASSGSRAFDEAWLKHIHRNKHHWQHYTLSETNGSIKIFEMPTKYRKELLADWIGANKAQGNNGDVVPWYLKHKNRILLGTKTRQWVEQKLGVYNG